MTLMRESPDAGVVDLTRWPAMAPPRPAPLRSATARMLLRRVAGRTGVRVVLADGSAFGPTGGPTMLVTRPQSFFARLGRDGKVGFGEAFMAGDWESPDLVGVLTQLARNVANLVPRQLQRLRRWYDDSFPADEDNDHAGSRRNIARHYDLSNDLFAAFLDESMTYSSALFDDGVEPLHTAQGRKIERLLDAAGVGSGSRVLEIGTGWGELAMRAAGRGAHVTTLTLSTEQASLAQRRISDAGLADRVDIKIQDYRDVHGHFDAVLSVEMIEAVGEQWWPTYFRMLDQCLAPGGRVGLQAILLPHDRMMASKSSWTWIHKYIFPGGLIPSVEAIESTLASYTSLRIVDRLHFGASYAETLKRWREQFERNSERIRDLGFDETFRRMWRFYLAYCEGGFRARYLDVAQFVMTRT